MVEDLKSELEKARVELDIESEKTEETKEEVEEVKEDVVEKGLVDLKVYEKFVQLPFKTIATLTGCKDLDLTSDEVQGLSESLKPLGDKYLPEWVEKQNHWLVFGFSIASIVATKLIVYSEFKKNKKLKDPVKEETKTEKIDVTEK